jgi:hypothetical protein
MARLTAVYNFGNNRVKARQHTGGAGDETGRAKNN